METHTRIATDSQRILHFHISTSSRWSFKAKINSDTRLLKSQHFILFSMLTVGAQKSNAPDPATTTIWPCDSLQPWKTLILTITPAFYFFFLFCPKYSQECSQFRDFWDFSSYNTISQYILSPIQCHYNKRDFSDKVTWNDNHQRSCFKAPNIIMVPSVSTGRLWFIYSYICLCLITEKALDRLFLRVCHRINRREFEPTTGNSEGQGSLPCCSP